LSIPRSVAGSAFRSAFQWGFQSVSASRSALASVLPTTASGRALSSVEGWTSHWEATSPAALYAGPKIGGTV